MLAFLFRCYHLRTHPLAPAEVGSTPLQGHATQYQRVTLPFVQLKSWSLTAVHHVHLTRACVGKRGFSHRLSFRFYDLAATRALVRMRRMCTQSLGRNVSSLSSVSLEDHVHGVGYKGDRLCVVDTRWVSSLRSRWMQVRRKSPASRGWFYLHPCSSSPRSSPPPASPSPPRSPPAARCPSGSSERQRGSSPRGILRSFYVAFLHTALFLLTLKRHVRSK